MVERDEDRVERRMFFDDTELLSVLGEDVIERIIILQLL